jgi:hypothetical protein
VDSPEAVGPADVAFIGSTLYYLQTHGGEDYGFPDNPTGIYRVNSNGTVTLIADIGEFNFENPVSTITSGEKQDIEAGGNPYSMIVLQGVFYVADGNQEQILRVEQDGDIQRIAEFGNSTVSTGLAAQSDNGPLYLSMLGGAPFVPAAGKVLTVAINTGNTTEIAAGASMLTDVEFGPGGQLYALQFTDTAGTAGLDEAFVPGRASIRTVNSDGTITPLVTGLSFATSLTFDGDTAYVSNFGAGGPGEVIKIEDFSSVTPPPTPTPAPAASPTAAAPVPTATTPGGIAAPDTGDGTASGSANLPLFAVLAGVAGMAILLAGSRFAWKR